MIPSLGRVVIFTDVAGAEHSARISRVDNAETGLASLHIDSWSFDAVSRVPLVERSYEKQPNTWRPPPRVGP